MTQAFLENPVPTLSDRGLLHRLFEDTAKRQPEDTAVTCAGAVISYEALEHSANRFARYLIQHGVQKGDRVCIFLPKSIGLYAAIIGILKTGASYVPIDPSYPTDRVYFIAEDCGAKAIVTSSEFREMMSGVQSQLLFVDEEDVAIKGQSAVPVSMELVPEDEAYVIYTSGTTGKPKGVMISHGNAYHYVLAAQSLYKVRPDDRVLQQFSIAFDASVEEIWVTFCAGATLVVGTPDVMRSGPEMPQVLEELKVTVLSCVPSFLTMFEGDIPGVRILILGGEACIPRLLTPWFSPDRAIYNTYGPTETTVVATASRCLPGLAVTIGKPLPNYTIYIMNEKGNLLEKGETGELVIGGKGVSQGYLNREPLTKRQFIKNEYEKETGDHSPILYRSGDRARINELNDIEYLGRIDTQVKIRGFRVELAEIESALMALPSVKSAVAIARGTGENARIDAFVIVDDGVRFREHEAITELKKTQPPYMIPSYIEVLKKFPTLPNGKINREGFPDQRTATLAIPHKQFDKPVEDFIYRSWVELFRNPDVSENDNFFTELGGHSLLAAQFVSRLRKDGRWADVSMRDIYDYPTIASLAAHLETKPSTVSTAVNQFQTVSSSRHILCGVVQLICLYFSIGFFSLQWVSPFLTYSYMQAYEYPIVESLFMAFSTLAFVYPVMLVIGILLKWVLIGRLKEGDYPLWGHYYVRWLFVQKILSSIPLHYLAGTPVIKLYLRFLGTRIGKDTHIDSDLVTGLDLLSIGNDTSINVQANISCHSIEDGLLKIRRVTIGNHVTIGIRSVVGLDTVIGDNATIDDLSCVSAGMRVGDNEYLTGSPATRTTQPAQKHEATKSTILLDILGHIVYGSTFFILPVVALLPVFPVLVMMYYFDLQTDSYYYLLLAPLVAVVFVLASAMQIALLKRVFLGKLKAGTYPIKSFFYFRKWVFDKLMESSLVTVGTLYATLYLHPWYRSLGVKLGSRSEVSTASLILPDLLTIGERSFIADGVILGAAKIKGPNIVLDTTVIGARSFVGNSALIPIDTVIGDDCLIGCQTKPPERTVANGTAWVGNPAVFLPKRERRDIYFAEETTYNPGKRLYFKRLVIEFFRVTLPSTAYIIFTNFLLSFFIQIEDQIEFHYALMLFPLLYIGLSIVAMFVTALMKYIIIGRYKSDERPLWSTFVWKTELITGFVENFMNTVFASHLQGTVFLPWYFRLMGVKIGKRACIHTMDFTDFDLVTMGDDVALNEEATIQTHLFEDRVMKLGPIKIGSRVTVGSYALVLYSTTIEDDVKIGDLSLVMKGETLPKNTRWAGSPIRPDPERHL